MFRSLRPAMLIAPIVLRPRWKHTKTLTKLCLISFGMLQLGSFWQSFCLQDKTTSEVKRDFNVQINRMKKQFGQMALYPQVRVGLRGNIYNIQFELDPRKSTFLSQFTDSSDFRLVKNHTIKQQSIVTMQIDFQQNDPRTKTPNRGSITITGIIAGDRPSLRLIFQKNDVITEKDKRGLILCYRQSIKPKQLYQAPNILQGETPFVRKTESKSTKQLNETLKKLQEMGITVFNPDDKINDLDWNMLAGYESQKRDIEDTVLLALSHPHIYDSITEGTRMKKEPNAPKAVLFEGPPGTGKTTSAKIIAKQVKIPLIYLPLEAIMSKFYGQSQKQLAEIWDACRSLGRVIIFIDQIDALAGSRSTDMHQASRRVLSTLLRKIDSFESTTDVLLICATNRKHDLDPAMLSRIDLSIKFDLPDEQSRAAIFQRYAKHLLDQQRLSLAKMTQGFSGRNISDVCKHAERRWASKLIRQEVKDNLPNLKQYIASLNERKQNDLA